MTALIAVEAPGGQVRSVCDAKCYNAMGADCSCQCQGNNHGMGREAAVEYIRQAAARQAAADAAGAPDPDLDRLIFLVPGTEAGADPELDSELEAEAG